MSINLIKEELRKLKRKEQAELMHYMVELLSFENDGISDEWKEELDEREKNLDSGKSIGLPAREVIAKYLAR